MRDASGATSIEYALVAALVSIVIVTVVTSIGLSVKDLINGVLDGFR